MMRLLLQTAQHKNPNFGGNQRKALVENLDASLKRMKLDYIDILYVHVWDCRTPVEETMRFIDPPPPSKLLVVLMTMMVGLSHRALDDVVRSGKVLYVAVSDTPAWVVSSANAVAQLRGWSPYIGLQTRCNLLDRSLEWELGPMARAHDIGIIQWGALAEGFLTGKVPLHRPSPLHRLLELEPVSDLLFFCVSRVCVR
jgi:aryl-alcohol dehydrogenase-like predicted oxidoreductase